MNRGEFSLEYSESLLEFPTISRWLRCFIADSLQTESTNPPPRAAALDFCPARARRPPDLLRAGTRCSPLAAAGWLAEPGQGLAALLRRGLPLTTVSRDTACRLLGGLVAASTSTGRPCVDCENRAHTRGCTRYRPGCDSPERSLADAARTAGMAEDGVLLRFAASPVHACTPRNATISLRVRVL